MARGSLMVDSQSPPRLCRANVVLVGVFLVFATLCYMYVPGVFNSVRLSRDAGQIADKPASTSTAAEGAQGAAASLDTPVVTRDPDPIANQQGDASEKTTEQQQTDPTGDTAETLEGTSNSVWAEHQEAAIDEDIKEKANEHTEAPTAEKGTDSQGTVSIEETAEDPHVADEAVKLPDKVPETLAWSETDLLPFYIHDLESDGDSGSWEKTCTTNFPESFCSFMSASQHRVTAPEKARLFLVPILESSLFSERGLASDLEALVKNRYFMRFRGSDFIFICYTGDCQATEEAVLKILGKAVRAIWVDRTSESRWPCSNRRIHVESDGDRETVLDWVAERARVEHILERAGELIDGRSRWSCEGVSTWGYETLEVSDLGRVCYASLKSVKHKVAFCGIQKVGSSVTILLMRRMNGMEDWKAGNTLQIRNFESEVDWKYHGAPDIVRIFNQTEWVKGVMVRNPITRLLSAYKSKIEQIKEYNRIPGGWPKGANPPTFEQFIQLVHKAKDEGYLDTIDTHFRPQSASCSSRTIPYDFIAHYENRQEDFHYFLKSLDLWEELGESGWGPSGNSSLYSEDEGLVRRDQPKPVTHADSKEVLQQYYTRDLVKTVMKLYAEDFERFGYSTNVDDYLEPPQ